MRETIGSTLIQNHQQRKHKNYQSRPQPQNPNLAQKARHEQTNKLNALALRQRTEETSPTQQITWRIRD